MCSIEGDALINNIVVDSHESPEYLIPSLKQLKMKVERVFGVQASVVLSEAREGVGVDSCGDASGKRQFRAFGEALLREHGVSVRVKECEEKEKESDLSEEKEGDLSEEKEENKTNTSSTKSTKPTLTSPSSFNSLSLPPFSHTQRYRYTRQPPSHASSHPLSTAAPSSNRIHFWHDLLPQHVSHTPFNRYLYTQQPPPITHSIPQPTPPTLSLDASFSTLTPSQNDSPLVCSPILSTIAALASLLYGTPRALHSRQEAQPRRGRDSRRVLLLLLLVASSLSVYS